MITGSIFCNKYEQVEICPIRLIIGYFLWFRSKGGGELKGPGDHSTAYALRCLVYESDALFQGWAGLINSFIRVTTATKSI